MPKFYDELEIAFLENVAGDPGDNLADGRIWLDTSTGVFKMRSSGATKSFNTADKTVVPAVADAASLPAAGEQGRVYFVIDTKTVYVDDGSAWVRVGGKHITGTRGAPISITAAGGINGGVLVDDETIFVSGNVADVNLTANPQISSGVKVGKRLTLVGGANTIILEEGDGLDLNGICELTATQVLVLEWDGTNWFEVSRRV